MLYLYTLLTASLLVSGQYFWKKSSLVLTNNENGESIVQLFIKLIFTPQFLIGAIFYIVATLLYVWLFSKYEFNLVQLTLVSLSIILTVFVSTVILKERLSLFNVLGVVLILFGAILVTWKK